MFWSLRWMTEKELIMLKHDHTDHLKCVAFKHRPRVRWTSYPWQVTPGYKGVPMSTRSFILIPGLGQLARYWRGSLRLWLWQRVVWGWGKHPRWGPWALQGQPWANYSVCLPLTSVPNVMQPLNTIRLSAPNFPSPSLALSPTSWNRNPFCFLEEFRSLSLMQVSVFS